MISSSAPNDNTSPSNASASLALPHVTMTPSNVSVSPTPPNVTVTPSNAGLSSTRSVSLEEKELIYDVEKLNHDLQKEII